MMLDTRRCGAAFDLAQQSWLSTVIHHCAQKNIKPTLLED